VQNFYIYQGPTYKVLNLSGTCKAFKFIRDLPEKVLKFIKGPTCEVCKFSSDLHAKFFNL